MTTVENAPEQMIRISTVVNGTEFSEDVAVRMHVADFLRQRLGLTGTHVGCEQGVCGMCTVIVDGESVKGCLMLACQLDGRSVQTVEGLSEDDELGSMQEAFSSHHALQCGFCTPGFLMTATALSYQGGCPDRDTITEEISGVLCRCTGYAPIVAAIEEYFAKIKDGAAE
ncbi:(2Fe-2S)-binding protein [Mycobacterium sp. MS1601]|uniref:(2Fe-2S)-binding protein n=1 Tax=Mycobacterium sp. MS1601 TaxID=1936029 RepID=UPI001F37711E|nr:(2Fe-2S)-binding protein [Mycobacterium sp. MS1601]